MHYWLPLLLIISVIIIFSILKKRSDQEKKLRKLKEEWGSPKIVNRNINAICRYLTGDDQTYISANTHTDLDIDSLFEYIDRTNSKPGQQYLYKQLHSSEVSDSHFHNFEQVITLIDKDEEVRDRIQLKLSALNSADAYYLPDLFSKKQESLFSPLLTGYIITSPALTILTVVSLFIIPNPYSIMLLFILIITNVIIHFVNKVKIVRYTFSLPQLLILIDVGKWLFKHNIFPVNEDINTSLTYVAKLKSSLSYVNLQNKVNADPTEIFYLFTEWLKMFLAIEPLLFIVSIKRVNKYLDDIRTLYEAVAQIDVAISIKSVRDGSPYYCKPQFTNNDQIQIIDLYHPLIENCVANSINIDNKHGVLVTGSNMSGKTTFIRAVAINALLSQTINTSFSRSYSAPVLKILTSIDINDDLADGKSYFQTEALSVKNIINDADISKTNSLIIIDEIFRGTNTIERIAAAKAVLSYLIKNKNFVFVSTHDLELAELLGNDYKVFSFEEIIGNDRLAFDYKIKEGLLKNRNGIVILKGLGFPDSIIDDANAVSILLRNKYQLQ